MKKSILAAISCLSLLVVFPACDQHHWEDSADGKQPGSKHLFEPHGNHGGEKKHGDEKHPATDGEAKKEGH